MAEIFEGIWIFLMFGAAMVHQHFRWQERKTTTSLVDQIIDLVKNETANRYGQVNQYYKCNMTLSDRKFPWIFNLFLVTRPTFPISLAALPNPVPAK